MFLVLLGFFADFSLSLPLSAWVSKWMRKHWTSLYVWVFAADSCPANAIARLFIAYFIFKPNIHIRSIEWLAHFCSIHQSMLTEMFAVLTKKRWASKREIIIKINGWHIYCYGRYVLMFVIYIFQWTLSKECIVQFSFDFVNFYCYRFSFCRCCSLIIQLRTMIIIIIIIIIIVIVARQTIISPKLFEYSE